MSRPTIIDKPWGHEEIWADTTTYIGKVLVIKQGERLSLQHHESKVESIRVSRGTMELELEDANGALQTETLHEGDSRHIPPGRRHRMRAITDVQVFEVSTPHMDDVVRHLDDYGRA